MNDQLEKLTVKQLETVDSLTDQISSIAETQQNIVPLLLRMIEVLEEFVSLDAPFLKEERIARVEATGQINRIPLREAEARGLLEYIDPEPEYLGHLATLVDLEGIRQAGFNIVVDPMFGAGAGYFPKLLSGGTTKIIEIRGEMNPAFPGMSQPEPLAHNLSQLMDDVSNETADIGIATDGDAD
ncbi:MAG: DUF3450 family protein, partial [Proteobacteria bacterium]|nr:DUF3450 family protein [Pseudomonadota bacterium]